MKFSYIKPDLKFLGIFVIEIAFSVLMFLCKKQIARIFLKSQE